MSAPAAVAPATGLVAASPAATFDRVRRGMLVLAGFSGAFVLVEPSPYEVFSLATIAIFALGGLVLSAALMPLVLLAAIYNVGLTIGLLKSLELPEAPQWVAVSWYLAATAIGFALIVRVDAERRLAALFAGLTAGALIAAVVGVVDWFGLLGGTTTLYGRARGTFKDPNVFGPYLVLPALLAMQAVLTARAGRALRALAVLGVLALGVFFSFSRGAWGHFAASALLCAGITWLTTGSNRARLRIVVMTGLAVLLLLALVAAAVSVDAVEVLLRERASLVQSYDGGHVGRFGRHLLGVAVSIENPLGLGPRQFSRMFPEEDPHNVYLNAFLSGGWIAGFGYVLLVALTLKVGASALRRPLPWRPALAAVYSTFVGVVLLGFVVDTDHWRHFWLLLGLVWGLSLPAARTRAGLATPGRTP